MTKGERENKRSTIKYFKQMYQVFSEIFKDLIYQCLIYKIKIRFKFKGKIRITK